MYAGSLMSGFSFDVSWFSIHGELGRGCCQIWYPNRVIWHVCCALSGNLGTIEPCRGTWEHTEGDVGVPGLDFYRFGRHFGVPMWMFWPTLEQQSCFFGMRVCRSRFCLSAAPEPSIWRGSYCKNQLFTYVGIMSILVSILYGFRWLWDQF